MSRSGYDDDCDGWDLIMWRGAVASAIRGRRGQAFLAELLTSIDAIPSRRLIADELEADGEVCALGAVGTHRGTPMIGLDPYDRDGIAAAFDIAPALAAEVMDINDGGWSLTPEERWERVRAWVVSKMRSKIPLDDPPDSVLCF